MDNAATTHTARALLDGLDPALENLKETTGIEGRIIALEAFEQGHCIDAVIEIYVDGKPYRYNVEAKTRTDRIAAVGQIKAQLDRYGGRGLMFTPYVTPAIAKQCQKLDLAFLDTFGNAYIRLPGLHLYVTGEKPAGGITQAFGAQTGAAPTALRLTFALLCQPRLLDAPYREIVDAAGIALGAVGWVFHDLKARGHITGGKKKNRRFLDAERLFDEWITNYPLKLRPKLNPRRFRAPDPDWWKTLRPAEFDGYWGGEVAADQLTNYLKPANQTLYLDPETRAETVRYLVGKHRLAADPTGAVEFVDTFWNLPRNPQHRDAVPPILVYADLVATADPRNIEVAKLIYDTRIKDALRKP